jgi:hypothetical protein
MLLAFSFTDLSEWCKSGRANEVWMLIWMKWKYYGEKNISEGLSPSTDFFQSSTATWLVGIRSWTGTLLFKFLR